MKTLHTLLAILGAGALSLHAETTPLNQPLTDEREVTITCELTQPPKASEVPVFTSPKSAEATKGSYHYKLWLPKGYGTDAQKKRPCMFIMSPGGNAGMGQMEAYLKGNGFVVVMLVEAKNGRGSRSSGIFSRRMTT